MVVSSRPSANLWRRLPRAVWAGLALAATAAAAFMACGGTTGREGLPGTPADGGSIDSTVDVGAPLAEASRADSGGSDGDLLDAGIQYADPGRLPEGGGADGSVADAGGPGAQPCWAHWPVCAPDRLLSASSGVIAVDDAGTCATRVWTGSRACDQCIRNNGCGSDFGDAAAFPFTFGVFPPCSDLREAGTAAQGPRAGDSLYAICEDLFLCVMRSSCATDAGASDPMADMRRCYCGPLYGQECLQEGGAKGDCKVAIEAAMQATPSTDPSYILSHLLDPAIATIHAAFDVMALLNCPITAGQSQPQANCNACFSGGLDPCSSGDTTGGPADAGTQ
jgi:hypothetical protein